MKHRLFSFATCLFMLALSLGSHAQMIVTGKLQSAKDKQPIPYANIAMMRATDTTFLRGVITDEQGVFSIKNDTIATVLRLSAMGYETRFVAVPNTRDGGPTGLGKIDMGTLVMHEGAMLLDVVKVTEKRPLYTVDGEKNLYNVAEDASIQTGNASDALQNAPGVEVDVEGNVTLNGQSV
ncbi:MAG: carboxypeptidase-like regulatory domain-containing protein, partial [Bacteroidales bacterium]|nr:carboxypeptidase-like regulatory domain-containing protein [Bacteroidales bacterium]